MIKRLVRIVLAILFLAAGSLHFLMDTEFARIVPPMLPWPVAIVWITGVLELGFAVLLLTGRYLPQAGLVLSLYLLAVLPANIYIALEGMTFGHEFLTPAILWARVILQFPLIWLVWRVTR